ncbi:unnamed protein product, partial [marine sediment metagenome]
LAIVGVMFLMAARVDKVATSAISENRELGFAIETIIAKISQELVLDVPGMPKGQDYYDYPGQYDKWLASLEPYKDGSNYYWRQISDVTSFLDDDSGWDTNDVDIDIVEDHEEIELDGGDLREQLADADGDGVADSKWIELGDITTNKGKPIYAAIRIVDNAAMLNVNTAYQFDANEISDANLIDGSSQMQINLMALAGRPSYTSAEATQLLEERVNYPYSGIDPLDLDGYEENVIWRYSKPTGAYTPFDIADELELRNRFLLNHKDIDTRLEAWGGEFRNGTLSAPVTSGGQGLHTWFKRAYDDGSLDPNYAYRHLATIYNMDRIIDPNGNKMININKETDANDLYEALVAGVDPDIDIDVSEDEDNRRRFAQLAVNIIDFADDNVNVTVFEPNDPNNLNTYYGFDAQPFITEVAIKTDPFPESEHNYFAVELYNPFDEIIDLNDFKLVVVDVDSNDPNSEGIIEFEDEIDANS